MNSIAIFYDKCMKLELDVNICVLENLFFEFGLKFKCNKKGVKTSDVDDECDNNETKTYERDVFLFLPFKITESNIESIALDKEIEVLKNMFNENISIEISKYTKVKYGQENFCVRNVYFDDMNFENLTDGTLIMFKVRHNPANQCHSYYYRIRFKNISENNIVTKKNFSNFFKDFYLTKSVIVDFNVNRKDALPKEIVDKMKYYNDKIYRVNTFIITDDSIKKDSSNAKEFNIKRNVDNNIWLEYYNSKRKLFFYHYKQPNVLAQFQEKKFNIFYVLFLILSFVIGYALKGK